MKNSLILSLAVLSLVIAGCGNNQKKSEKTPDNQFALVELTVPDLSGITENGKEVLNLYRFAARQVDSIYAGQSSFYPQDMTDEEFEALADPSKNSPYTLIRRDESGKLCSVWYHDAFRTRIDTIANVLGAAAQLTIKPSVKKYLLSKVDALRTDDYYASDIAWLEMDDSKMDLVIGPDEAVRDTRYGIKRSYEAFVMLKDLALTEQLLKYTSGLAEMQAGLPVAPEYKSFVPGGASNIFACNAIAYAGSAADGVKVIGINLPFDEKVQAEKGTRTIIFKNVIDEKFNKIVAPVGNVTITPDQTAHVDIDAFFWNTVFREVAHGLGVKNTLDGRTLEAALGSAAPVLEEVKADILGIYLSSGLGEKHELSALTTRSDAYVTFLASLIRSARFGMGSKVGVSNVICYNSLMAQGAFSRGANGKYTVDGAKMQTAVANLVAKVLELQAKGDAQAAAAFIADNSTVGKDLEEDFMNIRLEKVPVDIRFK